MCGIVGYIGKQDAKEILLKGLEKLEYRGYDSAGIALMNEKGVQVFKEKGRIAALRLSVDQGDQEVTGNIGIGHTRWATHGQPSRRNAHPHQSDNGRFTIVHNGVIENYHELKLAHLVDITCKSDTDTEIIVQLIGKFVRQGLQVEEAFRKTLSLLKGSYAVALIDGNDSGTIYVGKNKSPLLIGIGHDCHVIASDAMAMLQLTKQYVELMDEEMVIVQRNSKTIKNLTGNIIERNPFTVKLDDSDIDKGLYPHYMLKEIDEQPFVIRKLVGHYQDESTITPEILEAVKEADRIYMIACGTSYHAGLVGKQLFEKIADIPVEAHVASEFLYNRPLLSQKPFFVFISQSGETADCRGVLVDIKKIGCKTLTITNVPGSTLSREADYTLLTYAGPEIAVASTKAYTAQIAVLALFASACARIKGKALTFDPVQELGLAANAMEIMINKKEKIEELVWEYLSMSRNCFFIGRSIDYYVCLEGALKLKEISYIQAEGFAGGELKHGTIALIEEGTPVVALVTQAHIQGNIRSNVQEVMARGASVCMISMEGMHHPNDPLVIPYVHEYLSPLISVIPLQLMAYFAALFRGCDIDKPRNLAKSVTVE